MSAIHRTAQWQQIRKLAMERDGHRCQRCGRGKGEGVRLHVDHIVRVIDGGPAFELSNLRTLCASCHRRKSGAEKGEDNRRRAARSAPAPVPALDDGTPAFAAATPTQPPAAFKNPERGSLNGSEPSGLPRFFSDPHPKRVRSRADEWGAWHLATFGETPRPFQMQIADRLLEVDDRDRWCWSAFLISVPRQQGKSWLLRSILAWLASQGQLVVGTMNRLRTAAEVIRPLGRWCEDNGGRWRKAIDQPMVEWPGGGRVVFQAANDSLAVGWSPDAGAVDEAWDVPEIPVLQGLVPAMSDKDSSILLFTSTVGLTTSDLLNRYRSYALAGEGNVGIAEWSAPPGIDWQDEEEWRRATPEWSEKRLRFMRDQVRLLSENQFRSQMLNQSVHSDDGWIGPSVWAAAASESASITGRKGGTLAVEITLDGSVHYAIHAVRDDQGVVTVALHSFRSFRQVDGFLRTVRPTTVLAPKVYEGRLSQHDRQVSQQDVAAAMPLFYSALKDGRLRHPADERLTEQLLLARAHVTKAGAQTLIAADNRPLSAVRAMLWAVANETEVRDSRPRLRVAR